MKKIKRVELPLDHFTQMWYPRNAEIKRMRDLATALHSSDAWKKAPWRRKQKLAHKAYQRYVGDVDGYAFNLQKHREYPYKTVKGDTIDLCYCRALTTFLLYPLRIVDEYAISNGCGGVLRYDVPNALGNFLTRIARREGMFIEASDFFYARQNGIPFNKIPLRRFVRTPSMSRCEEWALYFHFKKVIDK
jgi:hypothetical protein